MNIIRRLIRPITSRSGWKLATIFAFSALLILSLLVVRANMASVANASSGPTITSDKVDYQPGATVTLTGTGWTSGEAVHIFVNDSVGNTWSLNSNPDPVADTNGGFTYSFSLPNSFIANYSATATGATSGTATTTFTDSITGCPSSPSASNVDQNPDNNVSASFTTGGSTATYKLSTANLNSSGGIPGLIEYCVYDTSSNTAPTSVVVDPNLKGADGSAWTASLPGIPFSFSRPHGDTSNIPFNGNTYTMGTATWAGNAPTSQEFVLHVNDPAFCQAYNGSLTCFVLPGTLQPPGKDLTVTKTATPSFTRTFTWGITKSVDQTKVTDGSGSHTFTYTVSVTHDNGTDSGWQVNGTIKVSNPNGFDMTGINVTDAIDNNGSCTVSNGTGVTVPANGSLTLNYTCTFSAAPGKGTNTATASWDSTKFNTPHSSANGTATYDFSTASPKLVDDSVAVTDTLGGNLGTVSSTDPSPKTFTYTHTVQGTPGTCVKQDNTATFTTNTSGKTGSASQSVQLCTPVNLTVKKDATPSFTRTFTWGISKSVDQTKVTDSSGSHTFNYTVSVTHDNGTDSGWQVNGTITVSNPNDFEDIVANVSDAIDNGGTCTVTGGTNVTVAAGKSVVLNYSCTYGSAPSPSSGTNTATASWDKATASTPDGSATGTATADFNSVNPTVVDGSVTVTDSLGGNLGTVKSTDPSPTTFTYTYTVKGTPGTCVTQDNTATFKTDTNGTTGSDSKTVTLCTPVDLKVTKTATPSFTRTFIWGIQKSVDKTSQTIAAGGTATFNYTVTVTHDAGTDSGWQVNGTITITNPNDFEDIVANVSDAIDNGGACTVAGGSNVTVPAGQSVDLTYSCTYSSAPTSSSGTNTATASWDSTKYSTPGSSATGTATADFSTPTTVVDGSVSVTDTLDGPLGTVSYTDPSPTTFTYLYTFSNSPTGTCTSYNNTATFKTDTNGTTGSASQKVTVCAAVDLTVSKTATPSFMRAFTWGISKSVDQTKVTDSSGSHTFTYTVSVTHGNGTDSGWQVNGTITISNPNDFEDIVANVSDAVDNGGACTVAGGSNVTVPAGHSVSLSYTCSYKSAPNPVDGTNTATASWDKAVASTPDSSATGTAPVSFSTTSPTLVDDSVTVTDPLGGGTLGTANSASPDPTTFTYTYTVKGTPGTCVTQNNTATFTTNTSGTTGTASQSVQLCTPEDLTVIKDANPSFTRTYNWSISKAVDKKLVEQLGGGTVALNYTVTVKETGFTDSGWQVSGTIMVNNPNDFESITLTGVTDAVDDGGTCSITGGNPTMTIPANGIDALSYTCTYASQPAYNTTATNTATATWDPTAASTPDGSASGSATFKFTTPATTVNKTVTVKDTFNNVTTTLGTVTATDSTPFTSKTFTYSHTVNVPTFNCVTYPNTATIVETGQTASASVEVCGPAKTGALTMGFWQNKNGQGIITNQAKTGACPSATWLTQYAPFQDLSSSATCSQVASYVTSIIKAANASGSAMNAMLKAQMLATALDVYFSDPSLGGNKIGAPAPIGGVTIDLTHICAMIDSSSGASCNGSFENVSSAFGGATSMTVSQMLAYAASQSNVGGSTWYGQNKTTQGLAKDAFDAINNQVAFAP